MTTSDFTTTLLTHQTPEQAYNTINNISSWWTENLQGSTDKVHDVFTVCFGTTWKIFEVIELEPGTNITWLVTDCCLPWNKNITEWTGTKVTFEISGHEGKTQVKFTHIGLNPEMACYNDCEKGWNYYLRESLLKLLNEGKGQPEPKDVNTSDFTITVMVDQSPEEAFRAITNVRGWWSEEVEGGTEKLNDEFSYHFQDIHSCRMKLIEVIPNKKIVWLVKENYFNFTKDKSEWIGTRIIFDISTKNNKTLIKFSHQGLVPEYECFHICSNAWTDYLHNSLVNLISIGKGSPNPKEVKAGHTVGI